MKPVHRQPRISIWQGNAVDVLREMPDNSVNCAVTSPPYWQLRDYGVSGQIGLEPTLKDWVERQLEVFREVRRILREDGTLWVNLGDSYSTGPFKPKDLVGQPWMLAFALREDGWFLRQDIIWSKPAPMPESVRDRFTKSQEYLFLLTKRSRYYWNMAGAQERATGGAHGRGKGTHPKAVSGWASGPISHSAKDHARAKQGLKDSTKFGRGAGWRNKQNESFSSAVKDVVETRNRRSVWTIPAEPQSDAHFAAFPTALVKPCILAGCPEGGIVLDPFAGSGTVGLVARELGCQAWLIELNPAYIEIAKKRLAQEVLAL